jgi:hypothetical protein
MVAGVGGGYDGGGDGRGMNAGYRGQWTAVEDHADCEERDDDEGLNDEAKDRCLRIHVTIVRKRLNEGRRRAHV